MAVLAMAAPAQPLDTQTSYADMTTDERIQFLQAARIQRKRAARARFAAVVPREVS